MVSSFPGPNVAPARVDASLWVTSWQGSRLTGEPDAGIDAGADAVGAGDGDAGADVAGATGGSTVGEAGALDDGAGAVDAGAIAVADSFGRIVTLLLFDDLQDVMSKAGVMTTRMSAARRCISVLHKRRAMRAD